MLSYSCNSFHRMALLLHFLLLASLHLIGGTEAPPPPDQLPVLAKPNCLNACGSVTIPFPFGIGTGCFLNEWYEVICQHHPYFLDTYTPRLKKSGFEVLNISLPRYIYDDDAYTGEDKVGFAGGSLNVSLPIFISEYKTCSRISYWHPDTITSPPLSLEGSPFIFSQEHNRFTVVGCNHLVVLNNTESVIGGGCIPDCTDSRTDNYHQYNCLSTGTCCQVTIPANLQKFGVSFTKIGNRTTGTGTESEGECDLAFLIAQPYNILDNELARGGYVPGILEWGIANDTDSMTQLPTMFNDPAFYCTPSFDIGKLQVIFKCYCGRGYRGNPYIVNGCQDIDECLDHSLNTCPQVCKNRIGGYYCGYSSDMLVGSDKASRSIISGVLGGVGSLALLALFVQLFKIIKRRRERKLREAFFKLNGGVLLQQQFSSMQGNFVRSKMFELNELEKATENFNEDRILGQGGQGTVYKGMLKDGRIVAIKKSKVTHKGEAVQRFINEVLILSQINHRNIVKLFGCCLESKTPILVYEFIPNGTLYQYLHTPNEERSISWEIRLRIATEVAGALAYLHCAASIPIYHRDIKSTNILLDELYRAKVADFGTSRSISLDQTHVTTLVQGTFGYLDPEYFRSSQFTDKSDVYSFGVVLVELITGQKPVCSIRAQEGKNLATYFIVSMEKDQLFEIIDPKIQVRDNREEMVAVADLAIRCLNLYGRQRPTMKEVAMILEGLNKCLQLPTVSNDLQQIEVMMMDEDFATESSGSYEAGPFLMTTRSEEIVRATTLASDTHSTLHVSTW